MPQAQFRRSPLAQYASAGVSGISAGMHSGDFPELTAALISIGRKLANAGYRFTTITPDSHAIIYERRMARTAARELSDIFGWNMPFRADDLDPELLGMLDAAGLLVADRDALRTSVRFSSIGERVYAHSAFPTCGEDDVFFGPDTYRFVHAARQLIPSCDLLIDVGCGSGAGGLELADRCGHVVLADINPRALAYAAANCAINGVTAVSTLHADVLDKAPRQPDAIIANPPYLIDAAQRTYRHGGGGYGTDLAVRIALEGVARHRCRRHGADLHRISGHTKPEHRHLTPACSAKPGRLPVRPRMGRARSGRVRIRIASSRI